MRALLLLITILSLGGQHAQAGDVPTDHEIVLTTEKQPPTVAVGESLDFEITYRNTDAMPWALKEPDHSLGVSLNYENANDVTIQGGYRFGKRTVVHTTTPSGKILKTWTEKVPADLSIEKGESHRFTAPLQRPGEWDTRLTPGAWRVWIQDQAEQMESERVEIRIVFVSSSIPFCLSILRDPEAATFRRKWAGELLQTIKPDLQIEWWHRDTPDNTVAGREKDLAEKLVRFEQWYKNPANAADVEAGIERINNPSEAPAPAAPNAIQDPRPFPGKPLPPQ